MVLKSENNPSAEPLVKYYLHTIDFLKIFAEENESAYDSFIDKSDDLLSELEKLPDEEPYKKFLIGEVYLQRSAIRFRLGKFLLSGWDFKKCFSAVSDNQRLFPSFAETYKTLGLLHTVLGNVPGKYTWALNLAGLEGNLQLGKEEMQFAIQRSRLVQPEAKILFAYLNHYFYEDNELALQLAQQLHEERKTSLFFLFTLVSIEIKQHKNDWVLETLKESERFRSDTTYFFIDHLDYFAGQANFQKNQFMPAIRHFINYGLQYHGNNFRADAYYKAGLACELSGNRLRAVGFYQRAMSIPETEVEEDRYAKKFAKIYLSRPLNDFEKKMREARNLFDGGYYEECLSLLNELASDAVAHGGGTPDERVEFYYRMGRVYDEMKKPDEALADYQNCFSLTPEKNLWMKVYAYYYSGLIYEEQRNFTQARTFYMKALSFSGYDYQNALEQKAKAGLQRVRR